MFSFKCLELQDVDEIGPLMGHWGWLRLASTQPKGSKYHIGLRNGGGLIWLDMGWADVVDLS